MPVETDRFTGTRHPHQATGTQADTCQFVGAMEPLRPSHMPPLSVGTAKAKDVRHVEVEGKEVPEVKEIKAAKPEVAEVAEVAEAAEAAVEEPKLPEEPSPFECTRGTYGVAQLQSVPEQKRSLADLEETLRSPDPWHFLLSPFSRCFPSLPLFPF